LRPPDPHERERWVALKPHLERLLDLPGVERARYIADLRAGEPELADALDRRLAAHRAAEQHGFLDHGPDAPADLLTIAGQIVGPYTLIEPIGYGGMGSVWLARRSDGRFERNVALKFLNPALVGLGNTRRFVREGNLLAQLTHPNIAQLLDAGVTPGGQPYLVLEHVAGRPIDAYCDERSRDIAGRIALFIDVLAAVAHAHTHLIVHRDLKPGNVFVADTGEVKLLDFGVATLLASPDRPTAPTLLTQVGAAAMTPQYAAPEQITGGPVSTATDVYALGVLLYLLLSGRHPAGDAIDAPISLVRAVMETEPRRPSDAAGGNVDSGTIARCRSTTPERLRRNLRGDLDTIVLKAIKKAPAERYASVTELADDLQRYLRHEPIRALADSFAYRARRFVQRNRALVALGTVAATAIIAGIAGVLVQSRTAREQRDFALRQLAQSEAQGDLDSFLLTGAAPAGTTFTVNELLAQAEAIVARQPDNPELKVSQLISIGRQYWTQDENKRALEVLESAYQQSLPLADVATRAKAACALASALARGVDLPRAERLIERGLAELPDTPLAALDRMYCLMRGSEVAQEQGMVARAVELAEAASRENENAPFRSAVQDYGVSSRLAEVYRAAGKLVEANTAFAQAADDLATLGRDRTSMAGTLLNNWGLSLTLMGRPVEAAPLFRRAIELSRVDATDEAVSPMLLANQSRALRDTGHFEEAKAHIESAYARAVAAGHEVVVNQSLLIRASIYREMGDHGRSQQTLDELEPRLRAVLPPLHVAFGSLLVERAYLAQARGENADARVQADAGVELLREVLRATGEGTNYLPYVLLCRARIAVENGNPDRAMADAREVLELLDASQPNAKSIWAARAHYVLARALRDVGRAADSTAEARLAIDHFTSAGGTEAPGIAAARELVAVESPTSSGHPASPAT
jgi:serine/threonine-protein kinase